MEYLSTVDVIKSLLSGSVLITTVILIPAALFYLTKWRHFRMLSKIPHYKNWPIVGDVLHLKREPTELYKQLIEFGEERRHFGIAKICPGMWPVVMLNSPTSVETLLRSNINIDKSEDYNFLHKWLGLGLLTSTGQKWKTRRRILTPSFHFNILKDFLVIMNTHAENLTEILKQKMCDKDEPFDIFPFITHNSLDIICDTAMGVNIDALHDGNSEYVNAVYLVKDAIAYRQRIPWYWPDFIYDNLPVGKEVNKAIDLMHQHAYKMIKERREMHQGDASALSGKHKAFLDMLLDCRDEQGLPLSDNDIREEVDTFMFEGHDTVSAASAHAVYLLGRNPDAQRKCREELDEIFAGPREITLDDLSKLTYLEWCIKETLRIYPSVPWFGRALTEDTEFDGYVVPKGVSVAVFTTSLHRDPKIFPNPEKFEPTRFSPDRAAGRHPYAYVPFSAGSRNCIGQRFAMMELKVTLATLLRNFNIVATQKSEEITPLPGLVLQPSAGIWVKLSSRD